jgi:predicted acylesterase/phospholipase RssA
MAETILWGREPQVDTGRVGISYSGGGALLLVELGVAMAFVELGVRPAAIAGVSAGAIAGAAHAIDPVHGEGIRAAARGLERISNRVLGLTAAHIALDVVWERQHMAALGSNEPIQGLLADAFRQLAGSERLTFGHFGRDGLPRLIVGATDRRLGTPVWFPDDADVADALVASSAIPGVFPPKQMTMAGEDRLLVDGGVVGDQPLSVLALAGCGTIYGCAVGYDGERLTAPANLIDNWMQTVAIGRHQAAVLEQDYVRAWLAGRGVIHHIHPEVPFPVTGFDFDRDSIATVMRDATEATKRWITEHDLLPQGGGDA